MIYHVTNLFWKSIVLINDQFPISEVVVVSESEVSKTRCVCET